MPPALDLQCDARCFAPCTERPDRITEDPASEDDALAVLAGHRKQCEERRSLCAECIERGRAAGRVK